MPLTLTVDRDRWEAYLRGMLAERPGLVPVAKGNGYGFGVSLLAAEAAALGVDMLAVGTYDELPTARERFAGDISVLAPWRPFQEQPNDPRLVHTVGRLEDLQALAASADRPRVLLEGLTSMRRHGLTPPDLERAAEPGVQVEGLALHLPKTGDRVAEVERWLALDVAPRVFVSYLTAEEHERLARRYPGADLRERVGTMLWLGDRLALSLTATVLDVHEVQRGERAGYRQRRASRSGHVVVVGGGTAHGIGLRPPAWTISARQRAAALAKGGLDAAGHLLSPYRVAGRQRWFLEPPHMQVSLLFLPASVEPPAIGDEVPVEVPFTTTRVDRVVFTRAGQAVDVDTVADAGPPAPPELASC